MTRRSDEEDLLQQVREIAKFSGFSTYHTRDSRRSDPGWPDLVLVRPPRIIFAELKSERGRLTPAQQEWIERLKRCGLEVHVWRPSQLHIIAAVLSRRQDDAAVSATYRMLGAGSDTLLERIQ